MTGMNRFYQPAKRVNLRLEIFGMSDKGCRRATNEDAFLIGDVGNYGKLLAVADGFGNRFGSEASNLALHHLREFLNLPSAWNHAQRMDRAFEMVNQKVEKHFRDVYHTGKAGTTLTAVLFSDNKACVAHVGNARVYLIRDGEITQITSDQTFAQVLLNNNLKPTEYARKTLLQAIGRETPPETSLSHTELLPDDVLLLCTDGLSNNLSSEEIFRIINGNICLSGAVEHLIAAANKCDGSDNITAVLARVCRTMTANCCVPLTSYTPLQMFRAA